MFACRKLHDGFCSSMPSGRFWAPCTFYDPEEIQCPASSLRCIKSTPYVCPLDPTYVCGLHDRTRCNSWDYLVDSINVTVAELVIFKSNASKHHYLLYSSLYAACLCGDSSQPRCLSTQIQYELVTTGLKEKRMRSHRIFFKISSLHQSKRIFFFNVVYEANFWNYIKVVVFSGIHKKWFSKKRAW